MQKLILFVCSITIILLAGCDVVKLPEGLTSGLTGKGVTLGDTNIPDTQKSEDPELLVEVKQGKLQEGITITADDGSFSIRGGQIFQPEFSSQGWISPADGFSKNFKQSDGKKVTITGTNLKTKFYGILELSKVYEKCSSLPSTRSYYLQIPDSYFQQAMGGNISVVYEFYKCKPEGSKSKNYTSWVLWLSDVPF